ncbi:LysR substrate-binding domain-containing protein [Subtercola vilae]|uniref:LysR substrate-binding domain-containing protein n=1 Tax=Subtercola vilae TaxID=2056433 RepID=A0A4T2C695_9MICO|nr:LysR substrate-binding domain-containing protein [Subtercola vilae]TIH39309.1 hypothetical protein D4765_04315 [Subtercola vilae]
MDADREQLEGVIALARRHADLPSSADAVDAVRAFADQLSARADNGDSDQPPAALVVAAAPGIPLDDLTAEFAAGHADALVALKPKSSSSIAARAVRCGAASIAIVRLPVLRRGLTIIPVLDEPWVVALPETDPLVAALEAAPTSTVILAQLAGHHLLHSPDEVPEWREIAAELRGVTVGQTQSFALGQLDTLDEQLAHVAAGNGIVIVPRSIGLGNARVGVVFVTVDDMTRHHLAVVHAFQAPHPAVAAFVEQAAQALAVHPAFADSTRETL